MQSNKQLQLSVTNCIGINRSSEVGKISSTTWGKKKRCVYAGPQNLSPDEDKEGEFRVGKKWARNVVLKPEHLDSMKGCILKLVGNKAE